MNSFNKLSIDNLKAKCKELGIIKYSKKNKKDLIKLIEEKIKSINIGSGIRLELRLDLRLDLDKHIEFIESPIEKPIEKPIENPIEKPIEFIEKPIEFIEKPIEYIESPIDEINQRIEKEIKKLSDILEKYVDDLIKQKIIEEYLLQLIPAGTKGVIRGNKFNDMVKKVIIGLSLDLEIFEIHFEKKCPFYITAEIPDWYIIEKSTNRVIIGMNQLDLWGGGQQINRGSKYIDNNIHNTKNSKLLCVVCNKKK